MTLQEKYAKDEATLNKILGMANGEVMMCAARIARHFDAGHSKWFRIFKEAGITFNVEIAQSHPNAIIISVIK
jgi:hypothetical protein